MKQTSVGRHVMLLCFLSHGSFVSDGGFHYAHIGVTNACTQFVLSKGKRYHPTRNPNPNPNQNDGEWPVLGCCRS